MANPETGASLEEIAAWMPRIVEMAEDCSELNHAKGEVIRELYQTDD